MPRNKSTQLGDKTDANWYRRKAEAAEFSPYVLAQRKSKSSAKFKMQESEPTQREERDWICEKLIETEVYRV
jgi:hypothetical protein